MRHTAAAFTAVVLLCYPCPSWSQDSPAALIAICDQAAAIPLDQSRPTGVAGVVTEKIDPKIAIPACDAAAKAAPNDPRVAFQLGRAYLATKNYEFASAHLKFAADQGDAGGQNGLGRLYARRPWRPGEGRPRGGASLQARRRPGKRRRASQSRGLLCDRPWRSAEGRPRGCAPLQARRGPGRRTRARQSRGLLRDGRGGLPKDEREAARLYKLAADQGNEMGRTISGLLRERPWRPAEGRPRGRAPLKLAADQGNAPAQADLGVFYSGAVAACRRTTARRRASTSSPRTRETHRATQSRVLLRDRPGGLAKDDREAARLFKLAADQGEPRRKTISGSSMRAAVAAWRRTTARRRASTSSPQTRETQTAKPISVTCTGMAVAAWRRTTARLRASTSSPPTRETRTRRPLLKD